MSEAKTYEAQGEVKAVNRKDPRRLGLLLRNADGVEKWFTLWKRGDDELPKLTKGNVVEFTYAIKPSKNGGDPFLNITDLEVTDKGDGQAADQGREVPQERAVEIRAAVALKTAASSGLAQSGEELLALADEFYTWLESKTTEGA